MDLDLEPWMESAAGCAGAVAVAVVVYLVLRSRILQVIEREIRESPVRWDDSLLGRRVPQRIALLLPAILGYLLVSLAPDDEPGVVEGVQRVLLAVTVLLAVFVISALLNAANEIYEAHYDNTRDRPIKGYLQILNTIVFLGGSIVIVAVLADRSPMVLLGGLGALTAVLLLVFQDTISGFVASVQLHNYDVIRHGDWIEAPEYGADGEVVDVTVHTVKVLNADNTMVTIPTVRLTQGGFTNWRPIYERGGRRIQRSIRLDVSMVRFLTAEEVDRLSTWPLLRPHLADHAAGGVTNVGALRAYAQAYVRSHPKVHGDPSSGLTAIVRLREATPDGLPLEVYAFSKETGFEAFEEVQAEIFDHLLAVVPEFGLRVFQNPTGADMMRLGGSDPTLPVTGPASHPNPLPSDREELPSSAPETTPDPEDGATTGADANGGSALEAVAAIEAVSAADGDGGDG